MQKGADLLGGSPAQVHSEARVLLGNGSIAYPKAPQSALIDQCGLRGFRVGNAAISEKHAGFAVNLGGATAEEVRTLLQTVSDKVYAQTGIRLEPEVRIW